jgi:DNA-binding FrmR family transcriptional regulator
MASTNSSHVLQDQETTAAILKRLKRANGQMTAVVRMLEEGRTCEDIVTQLAAVGKAVNTAAISLISASLRECLLSNEVDGEVMSQKLQKLFLSLA